MSLWNLQDMPVCRDRYRIFLHGFVDGEVRKPEWVLPAASGNEGLAVRHR
jgi:hypothetical protein